MQQYNDSNPQGKDPELWDLAKKRAGFKSHLATYLAMQPVFWIIWWLSGAETSGDLNLPWPVWPAFGWGIGVFFHFLGTYVFQSSNSVQREYDKLEREQKR